MTGMKTVTALRRAGVKPKAVFVDLVERLGMHETEAYALAPSGIVAVNIVRGNSLTDIDFRPLVGLRVFLNDYAGDAKRFRKVANLIAAVNPAHLIMAVQEGETLAVHQRWAGDPVRTETFRV